MNDRGTLDMATRIEDTRAPAARAGARAVAGRRDLGILTAFGVGLLGLTALPYLFGYLTAPADRQFMGILLNVPDTAQYLSWARELGRALLSENKLTPEPDQPIFFNLFWLAVGRGAGALGLGLAETLQLARLFAGAAFLGAIYWFTGLLFADRRRRWVSFLLITLGGGFGWLYVIGKQFSGVLGSPLDLYIMEPNTFLSIMAFPLQAMAGGMLVLVLGLSMLAFERDDLRPAVAAGFLALGLGLFHGYDLIIVYTVVGGVAFVLALRQRRWIRLFVLCAAICGWSAPAALYLFLLTRASPVWRGVLAQYGNAGVYTPNPPHLLVLMGLPLLLVLVGLVGALPGAGRTRLRALRELSVRQLLLGSWLVLGFVLLYLPTDFQVKMLGGWQIPVGIVATTVAFDRILPLVRRAPVPFRRDAALALGVGLVLAVLPANLYLYAWRFVDLGRHDLPYYLNRDDLAAMRWLETNTRPSDVVLSSLEIGQYIPAETGNKAFLAHWAQTLDFYEKRRLVAAFFTSATPDRDRLETLAAYHVGYVFWGPRERALGGYDPSGSPYLEGVFQSPTVSVFRVRDARLGAQMAY